MLEETPLQIEARLLMSRIEETKLVGVGTRKSWQIGGQRLLGAHTVLERWYWPWKDKAYEFATGGRGQGVATSRKHGKAIGTLLRKFLDSDYTKKPKKSSKSTFHKLIDALIAKNLRIVSVEFPIGSSMSNVGTGVDLIVQDINTHRLSLCELKCGYDGYWDKASPGTECKLSAPLSRINASAKNKAVIQLSLARVLMEMGLCNKKGHIPFTTSNFGPSFVIYVPFNGAVRFYELEKMSFFILLETEMRKKLSGIATPLSDKEKQKRALSKQRVKAPPRKKKKKSVSRPKARVKSKSVRPIGKSSNKKRQKLS